MATSKVTDNPIRLGTHKLKPMQVFNLVPGSNDVAVVVTARRTANAGDALNDIKQDVLDSPWRDDDLAKAQIKQNSSTPKLKDPVATLRKVNELLSRQ